MCVHGCTTSFCLECNGYERGAVTKSIAQRIEFVGTWDLAVVPVDIRSLELSLRQARDGNYRPLSEIVKAT